MADIILVDLIEPLTTQPQTVNNGLRYLAAYSRAQGLEVKILFNFDHGLSLRQVFGRFLKTIEDERPLLIGFSPLDGKLDAIINFVKILKARKSRARIVLGGHFATFNHYRLLKDFDLFDIIVRGEGEITLAELANKLKANREIKDILGISYKVGRKICVNNARPNIIELDSLPYPATDGLEEAQRNGIKLKSAPISSSRGCYGNCSFCSVQEFYKIGLDSCSWRGRSADNVIDEITLLQDKFGISLFNFMDDNFMGPGILGRERAVRIANKIISHKLKIKFTIYCRSNDIDENTIKRLKIAGLRMVYLGIESGIPRALRLFNKMTTVQQNERALNILMKNGLLSTIGFILFDPYLTPEELSDNASYLQHLLSLPVIWEPDYFRASRLIPLSGTSILDKLKNDKLLKGSYLKGYSYTFKNKNIQCIWENALSIKNIVLDLQQCIQSSKLNKAEKEIVFGNLSQIFPLYLKFLEKAGHTLAGSVKIKISDLISKDALYPKILNKIECCINYANSHDPHSSQIAPAGRHS